MAASANPSGNQEGNNNNTNTNTNGHHQNQNQNQHLTVTGGASSGGNPNNNNGKSSTTVTDNSSSSVLGGPVQSMKHNPGLSVKWTPEEQSILDDGFTKIAVLLNDKTVRDVALRCRWMTKKESGKRRKEDVSRKNKDKKEKVIDPSAKSSAHLAVRPNVPSYAPPVIPLDNDDGISFKAIGGPTGHLLEQNAQIFDQISANFATLQIHENINLFCQTRDNILTIMNDLNDMPGIMKQMPALPVKVNEELAHSILPRTTRQMQS
ncbi:hypothetical protein AQUCO_10800051v1 [Aquilegia coerulea]|uniref:Myb-like domain-containing protein n=1 Tax=Aquilegia coerulea TaxID=218851 RepID=A0A2G5C3E3_AQUCA|nr:hypothetical protein AQUCO_10800051v1 [Aquilegia coerulea]